MRAYSLILLVVASALSAPQGEKEVKEVKKVVEPAVVKESRSLLHSAIPYNAPGYAASGYAAPGYAAHGYTSYSAPGYAAHGYTAPSYAAAGYAAPKYASAGYVAPSYVVADYAAPSYAAAGYRTPAFTATGYKAEHFTAPQFGARLSAPYQQYNQYQQYQQYQPHHYHGQQHGHYPAQGYVQNSPYYQNSAYHQSGAYYQGASSYPYNQGYSAITAAKKSAVVKASVPERISNVVSAPGATHVVRAHAAPAHIVKAADPAVKGAVYSGHPEPYHVIVKQAHDDNYDGSFAYSYETDHGVAVESNGFVKNAGTPDQVQVMQGSYTYYTPEGVPITTTYVADENGFQVQGDHLPQAPEMPEAIAKSIAYQQSLPPSEEDLLEHERAQVVAAKSYPHH